MTIKERIAKILIETPFDEAIKDDPQAYAMALAEAIENDMTVYDCELDCSQCDTDACDNPDCFKTIVVKGFRVNE